MSERNHITYMLAIAGLLLMTAQAIADLPPHASLVYPGPDGKLVYVP